jgi:predicted dehydrogenase
VDIGIIGCGGIARRLGRHSTAVGGKVVAASDPFPESLSAFSNEFGARAFVDAESLCRSDSVEAVIIASPPGCHLENVLTAAAAGKPIFCEKPLGIDVAECDRMIDACESAGIPLYVGQVLRLFPLFWHSHELVKQGRIGVPRALAITRTGYSPGFAAGWRCRRDMTGGLLLEINAHELDYMRFLLGEPVEVYARMDNILGRMEYEDQAFVMVTFKSGAVATLHSSMSSPIGEYRVHLQGTEGNLIHSGFGGSLKWKRLDGEETEVTPDDLGLPDPYARELKNWMDSLSGSIQPFFTGTDGRAAVAMAEAAYRSAAESRPIGL